MVLALQNIGNNMLILVGHQNKQLQKKENISKLNY